MGVDFALGFAIVGWALSAWRAHRLARQNAELRLAMASIYDSFRVVPKSEDPK